MLILLRMSLPRLHEYIARQQSDEGHRGHMAGIFRQVHEYRQCDVAGRDPSRQTFSKVTAWAFYRLKRELEGYSCANMSWKAPRWKWTSNTVHTYNYCVFMTFLLSLCVWKALKAGGKWGHDSAYRVFHVAAHLAGIFPHEAMDSRFGVIVDSDFLTYSPRPGPYSSQRLPRGRP